MTPAIYKLVRQHQVDPASADAFVASHQFPIVEDSCVTFVYRGEADAVVLEHWIFGLPPVQPFTRMQGSDLWFLIQEVPQGSRIEYRLGVVRRGKRELITDPLNPRRFRGPDGPVSVLQARGYVFPEWSLPDPEARQGTIEELSIESEAFSEERRVKVYVPARFRKSRRYSLLVVNDGEDFLEFASFKTVLDNLIYRLEIAPLVVALHKPGDRLKEYNDDPRHARFIAEELLPRLVDRYPVSSRRSTHGLMGVSYGAIAALATAWRYPGLFEHLTLQSSSFSFPDDEEYDRPSIDPVMRLMSGLPAVPTRPAERIFLSCGLYETRIHESRSLLALLQSEGIEVRYVEPKDGHNWGNWRDLLRESLSWHFPGPMWMVYE